MSIISTLPGDALDLERKAFFAWVEDCGCDTDGAWSAWQARAVRSVTAHTTWQPIETAPKDATRIMLAVFSDPPSAYPASDFYHLATWDGYSCYPYVPNAWTHWMPLPPAPSAAEPDLLDIVKRLAALRDGLDNGNSSAEFEACRLAELAHAALARTTGSAS